jgi:hypothetical protein
MRPRFLPAPIGSQPIIGSWPVKGRRIRKRVAKPDEPETTAWEETVTAKETAASKEATMETAIVKRETTTAQEMGSTSPCER